MIIGIYATPGVFPMIAARNLLDHLSLSGPCRHFFVEVRVLHGVAAGFHFFKSEKKRERQP
jgi:hypothetical protein